MPSPSATEKRTTTRMYAEWYPSSILSRPEPPTRRERWDSLGFWGKALSLVFLLALTIGAYTSGWWFLLLFPLYMLVWASTRSARTLDFTDLAPNPLPEWHFATGVELCINGTCYGNDLGIVALSDGWFLYEGGRCRFALKPSDVIGYEEAASLNLKLRNGTVMRLIPVRRWRNGADIVTQSNELTESHIINWQRLSHEPDGRSIYPPRVAQRGFGPAWNLGGLFVSSLITVAVALVAYALLSVSGNNGLVALVIGGLGVVGVIDHYLAAGFSGRHRFHTALYELQLDGDREVRAVSKHALICGTEPHMARLVRVNLERDGYEVQTAMDAREAVGCLYRRRPDMVVFDVTEEGTQDLDKWLGLNAPRTRVIRLGENRDRK